MQHINATTKAGRVEEEQVKTIKLSWGNTPLHEWNSVSVGINSGMVKSQPKTLLDGFHISPWSVDYCQYAATVTNVRCLFSKLCVIIRHQTQRSIYCIYYSDAWFQVWLQCRTQPQTFCWCWKCDAFLLAQAIIPTIRGIVGLGYKRCGAKCVDMLKFTRLQI